MPTQLDIANTTVLDGFTIDGGNALNETAALADDPYAIECEPYEGCNPSPPVMCDCYSDDDACTDDQRKPAGEGGGGMERFAASPTIRNCTFRSNSSTQGGSLRLVCGSNPLIVRCAFTGNDAIPDPGQSASLAGAGSGGGLYVVAESNPNVINCRFDENTAAHIGGGCGIQQFCSPNFMNCTFYANSARDWGGGMRAGIDTGPYVVNCTFYENWDTGNLEDPPKFLSVSPQSTVTFLRLAACSNAIDAGNDSFLLADQGDLDGDTNTGEATPLDLADVDRVGQARVDIGAFERFGCASDLDLDGDIDAVDLGIFLRGYGPCGDACPGDLDCDDDVDPADLAILLGAWGACAGGGNSAMAASCSETAGSISPIELAESIGFDSIDELVAWLDTLDFEAMKARLEVALGN